MTTLASASVLVGLNAAIAAIDGDAPKILCVKGPDGHPGLPYGPFDPARHRTFEIGLRDWVERQTRLKLGFIEQLYTFGDKGRESPAALIEGGGVGTRIVSVGYLALAAEPANVEGDGAQWRSWYDFFPWEDWRSGVPALLSNTIMSALRAWAERAEDENMRRTREERIGVAFGVSDLGWEEERTLDRYELMYEAGLVEEAWRDRAAAGLPAPRSDPGVARRNGTSMGSDHRRMLATAIGRVRGKLKYRPIIFDLTTPTFTLLSLQQAVEAIVGFELHKQNFRRSVERGGFVEKTELSVQQPSGRPAAVFKASDELGQDRTAKGLTIPRLRQSP